MRIPSPSNLNFDQGLRLKQGAVLYHENKVKAGRSSSSAGQPRPYGRQTILIAHLYSPRSVGRKFTVAPRHPYLGFLPGHHYTWTVTSVGVGEIDGEELEADEIKEHFVVVVRGAA